MVYGTGCDIRQQKIIFFVHEVIETVTSITPYRFKKKNYMTYEERKDSHFPDVQKFVRGDFFVC